MRRLVTVMSIACVASCGVAPSGSSADEGSSGAASLGGGTSGEDGPATSQADGAADDPEPGTGGDPESDDDSKFDVGSPGGDPACGRGPTDGAELLSYIWIANSPLGTVSKLDTESLVEEGRYIVRPDSAGSPSRTSVNLNGDMAIANRNGGVTKIYARAVDCLESNGTPGIQTSTGAADVLPWGEEECVAWHTPLECSSNRPIAWTQGTWSSETCRYEDTKVWTECWNPAGPEVMLLDGETGNVEQAVVLSSAVNAQVYGGAVDGDGNFWGVQTGHALIRVDRGDFGVQTWPIGVWGHSYGIAVDNEGRPWLCGGGGGARFDIASETYESVWSGNTLIGGCMVDADGILWNARYPDGVLVGVDTDTVEIVTELPIPAYVHGISIDFHGNVWGVTFAGSEAYRVDPTTGQVDTYAGLTGAYTYSDMTGFALTFAGSPAG